jgi:hypothetical protein
MHHLYHFCNYLFYLCWPPLHAKHLPHHPHIHSTFLIVWFAMSVCVYHNSSSSSASSSSLFVDFIVLSTRMLMKLLSVWCCPTVLEQLQTCMSIWRTQKWRLNGLFSLLL